MSRETKIGLVLILVLVGAFGFVVVRKLQRRSDLLADDAAASPENKKKETEPIPPYGGPKKSGEGGGLRSVQHEPDFKATRERPGQHGTVDSTSREHQHTPAFPADQHRSNIAGSSESQQTGNPFQNASGSRASGVTTVKSDGFDPGGQTEPDSGNPFPGGSATVQNDGTAHQTQNAAGAWDLGDGSGTRVAGHQPQEKANGNPFAQTGRDRQTHDDEHHVQRSQQTNDGFQNADTRQDDSGGGPFDGNHRQTAYQRQQQQLQDGRSHDVDRRGDADHSGDSSSQGLFGGTVGDGRAHASGATTTDDTTVGSPRQNDPRFGAYNVGTGGQAQAHSTTRVRTIGTGESLEYPFGKPAGIDKSGPPSRIRPDQDPLQHVHDSDRPRIHTVQPSDNYWTISRKAFGTGVYYHALAAYNRHRIPDPKKMRPGMKVLVPTVDVLAARFPALCPRGGAGESARRNLPSGFYRDQRGNPMFRVGKTDTLSGIAQKHLGRGSRWIQVYRMNSSRIKNPNRLKIGTELQLPADASNIRVVRRPSQYR
ncbi:MAG: LysM peptidoglycan-binding domain-containing protein [Planctomycetaceae bacterium]